MSEEKKPENRFESEMTRMMESVILKLGGFETKFDTLETRFDSMETRFDTLETRFDSMETRFDTLETRFDSLEKDVSEIKSDVQIIKGQFNDVAVMAIKDNKRITKLEGEVAELQSSIH